MYRLLILLGAVLVCHSTGICASADDVLTCVVSGVVTDADGRPLAQAHVTVAGSDEATVTNDDGAFRLLTAHRADTLWVSHVGYFTQGIVVERDTIEGLRLRLRQSAIVLDDVLVMSADPYSIVRAAIDRIPDNYGRRGALLTGFYRETVARRGHYTSVAEAVVHLYKHGYGGGGVRGDKVGLHRGRRLRSQNAGDTLGVKIVGGPNTAVMLDLVANRDFLLNDDDLVHYRLSLQPTAKIDNRPHYVVQLHPLNDANYALFDGYLYIDCATLALRRAELSLDTRDRDKATRYMLRRRPVGLRFVPRELQLVVDYRPDADRRLQLGYVRSAFRFDCDWERRREHGWHGVWQRLGFHSTFTAVSELVVTDRVDAADTEATAVIVGVSHGGNFGSYEIFQDRVAEFEDPDFWRDYNIILPSESLENATSRLLRRVEKAAK